MDILTVAFYDVVVLREGSICSESGERVFRIRTGMTFVNHIAAASTPFIQRVRRAFEGIARTCSQIKGFCPKSVGVSVDLAELCVYGRWCVFSF